MSEHLCFPAQKCADLYSVQESGSARSREGPLPSYVQPEQSTWSCCVMDGSLSGQDPAQGWALDAQRNGVSAGFRTLSWSTDFLELTLVRLEGGRSAPADALEAIQSPVTGTLHDPGVHGLRHHCGC